MDVSAIIAIIGGIALLVGVFGGGVQLEKLVIPPVNLTIRIVSFALGIILLIGAVIVSKPEFLNLIPAQPAGSVTVQPPDPTKPLLSDDFDNSSYNGNYDTSLWTCDICAFEPELVNQNDGSLRLEGKNGKGGGLVAIKTWHASQVGYAQWRMKLQNTDNGGIILFFNTDIAAGTWSTNCFMQRSNLSTTQAMFGCGSDINANGQTVSEYSTQSIAVNYNEWHTIKMELIPETFKIRYFLDDKLIGEYTPVNADELKNKVLRFAFGVYTDTNFTGYIDDVIVQPAK